MTEPESTGVAADPIGVASAGSLLRAAREKQGLHLAALAASLKVAPRKLELLETDRYDELPDATFTRALALSVCRVLKIDATPVLVRLPQSGEHGLEQVARGLNQPFRDRITRQEPGEWQRLLSLPAISAVLLLVAAVVIYLMPERPIKLPTLASFWPAASAPAAAAAAASAVVVAASEPQVEAKSAVAPEAPASTASAPSALNETVFSAPPASSADSATAAPLALRAIGSSWVEVRDRDGRVLLSRTLNTGETVGVDGAMPLKVVIGNADVTQLSFRGQPVALAAVTKDNVARLELK